MEQTHIAVVLGTARIDRQSEKVAKLITDIINETNGVSGELVDVKEHVQEAVTMPPWGAGGADKNPTAWKEVVQRSQALILVVPEYNHGYPGELKLLLDSLWEDYKGMPVSIVGVSTGTLGGARVIDHIKPVLIELHLYPIREGLNVSKVKELFNEEGSLTNEKTKEYAQKMIDELAKTALILKPIQEGE